MATISPFRGVRYHLSNSSKLGQLVAPPYDVISVAQKKQLLAANPFNAIRLILGNPSVETHKPLDYKVAGKAFRAWQEKSVLKRDEEPSLYVYQQSFKLDGKTFHRTGFIGLSKLMPFGSKKGGILAHEHTLSGPKADRLKLMKSCHSNFSCIFSLYPDKNGIGAILKKITSKKPDMEAKFPQDVDNRVWKVSDKATVQKIQQKMKSVTLFIADGHHRYETALAYQDFMSKKGKKSKNNPFDHVLMMFVAMEDPGLVILPTHRMLTSKVVGSPSVLLSRLSTLGEVSQYRGSLNWAGAWKWLAQMGRKQSALGFSFDGKKLYALRFSKAMAGSPLLSGLSSAQRGLDVTLLHRLILEPFFGITPERVEHDITFTSKAEEAVERLRKKEFATVFFLNPTRIGQLKEVALKQERMPQKSTYFYPKLVTGLVFNRLDSF